MTKENKGLGRGLSSLIRGSEDVYKQTDPIVSHETKKSEIESNNVSHETQEDNLIKENSNIEEFVSHETKEEENSKLKENNIVSSDVSHETSRPRAVSETAINSGEAEPEVYIREEPHKEKAEQIDVKEKENIDTTEEDLKNKELVKLDIDLIDPNPDQPRTSFDEQKLQELAHSIKDQGILQPIVVRKKGDRYQIIAGERRWQASRIAGLKEVPCVFQDVDDDKALELALIENIQRDDLNPIEEAYSYKRLMDKLNYTQADLAKAVAKGRSTIANAIRLLDLPEEAQEAMFKNQITAGHARAVLSVPNTSGRIKLTERIISDKLTVREAESLARLLSVDTSGKVRTNTHNLPSAYTAMAKSLKEVLNTQVRVKRTKSGTKLEIDFKNEDELRSIYEKLTGEKSE